MIDALASGEFWLLVLVVISFVIHTGKLRYGSQPRIHEYENFEELVNNLIECNESQVDTENITAINENIYIEDPLRVSVHYNNTELEDCAIDANRLKVIQPGDAHAYTYAHILPGGYYKPRSCKPRQKVAVIVPYRDRAKHLEVFAPYLHQFLPDQLIEYKLYVIEQDDNLPFNRAKLFNIGVVLISDIEKSSDDSPTCCYVFHDVDMLPTDQRNLYMCSARPRHMSPSSSTMRYHLIYPSLFGGVIALSKKQFEQVRGFSNEFYGWGGEDDDMFRRIMRAGLDIDRTPRDIGLYTMLRHLKATSNSSR